MTLKNISIKTKIFIVFVCFAIALLLVLWIFQIGGLTTSYRAIKENENRLVVNQVERMITSGSGTEDKIDKLAAGNNSTILVATPEGKIVYASEYLPNSSIAGMSYWTFSYFYDKAVENGGEVEIKFEGDMMNEMLEYRQQKIMEIIGEFFGFDPRPSNENGGENEIPKKPSGDVFGRDDAGFRQNIGDDMAQSLIHVKLVSDGVYDYVIIVNSILTPVDATVSTLKFQLLIITIIFIILATIAAFVISRMISKSLISLNESAKRLAQGDYSVDFYGRDYLEVSQLSDTLNYAASELEKTENLREELIANVSHDLRTPLTMITGYAEAMRDLPGENNPENVQVIIDEAQHLTGLVNDMLDLSKLKAKSIEIEPAEYNFTESIYKVLDRYNKLREQEGYVIDFDYDEDAYAYADEAKMHQVIYNLINNAINYTGDDKCVRVRQVLTTDKIRLEVTDSGEGIAPEDIPYIWDRYYKVDKTHKRAVSGTGLGLSIVKKILELHGADYGVESEMGCGSTFWFEIKRV